MKTGRLRDILETVLAVIISFFIGILFFGIILGGIVFALTTYLGAIIVSSIVGLFLILVLYVAIRGNKFKNMNYLGAI